MSAGGSAGSSDQWIMKNLNDLRADQKEQNERFEQTLNTLNQSISGLRGDLERGNENISARVGAIEGKINRLHWTVGGIAIAITAIWGIYSFATSHFDISVTPKSAATSTDKTSEPAKTK